MIAVPCWSSWNTGIRIRWRSFSSISKHAGAAMSSRLMPPNVGSSAATMSTNLSTSFSAISRSNTSISANFLNRHALPSITGLPAAGPMSPRPSTAVPLEITATRFARAVYSHDMSSSFAISRHGSATPGVYARLRSIWLTNGLVGMTSSFPLRPRRWYSSASSLRPMRRP
jgi:hypothetical protein